MSMVQTVKVRNLVCFTVALLITLLIAFMPIGDSLGIGEEIAHYNWSYRGFSVADLLSEREGFGRFTIGGLNGKVYHVTTLADRGPGSLREAAESSGPLWIVFDVNGTINLSSPIRVRSYKTIDGRGAKITISGYGLSINGASDVIIVNLRFDTAREPGVDAIEIRGSKNVWIHHCDITNYSDGAIDIVKQATNITISWCRFWNHDKLMLIGNSPTEVADEVIHVTLHHNFFFRTVQRHPRLRFGKVDAYNNYYYGWQTSTAIAVSMRGQILLEANIFEAEDRKTVASPTASDDPEEGYIKLVNNLFLNSATARENKPEKVFRREDYYQANVEAADEALKEKIMAFAGADFPAEARVMKDHHLTLEDFRWKEPVEEGFIQVGNLTRLYAITPPCRSLSERISIYEWNFGDGERAQANSISVYHIYRNPGNYTIEVVMKNQSGAIVEVVYAKVKVVGSASSSQPNGSGNIYSHAILMLSLIAAVTLSLIFMLIIKYYLRARRGG